jgi:phosphate transport system permease protein
VATTASTIEHAPPRNDGGARAFVHRLRHGDEIAHVITLIFAAGILLITSMLVFELWANSHLSRAKFGWAFFWTSTWDPIFGNFGAAPFIYGTLITSVVSLAIAVPLGLAAAVYLAELAPRRMSDSIAFMIDLLAAVPSVVYGVLGIFIVVPLMRTTLGPELKHSL